MFACLKQLVAFCANLIKKDTSYTCCLKDKHAYTYNIVTCVNHVETTHGDDEYCYECKPLTFLFATCDRSNNGSVQLCSVFLTLGLQLDPVTIEFLSDG